VGAANLAAGTYNLVLIFAQWSVGPTQPVGTLPASTTNNNVVLMQHQPPLALSPRSAADAPKIEVASPGTLGIGFSISANLSANSFIKFKLSEAVVFFCASEREKKNRPPWCVFLSPLVQQSRCVALKLSKLSPFSLPCDDDDDDDDVCGGMFAEGPLQVHHL
jgi:hypothetical protein